MIINIINIDFVVFIYGQALTCSILLLTCYQNQAIMELFHILSIIIIVYHASIVLN